MPDAVDDERISKQSGMPLTVLRVRSLPYLPPRISDHYTMTLPTKY